MTMPIPYILNWREKESCECILSLDVSNKSKHDLVNFFHETCIEIKMPNTENPITLGIASLITKNTMMEEINKALVSKKLELRLPIRIKSGTIVQIFKTEKGRSVGIEFTLHKNETPKKRGRGRYKKATDNESTA